MLWVDKTALYGSTTDVETRGALGDAKLVSVKLIGDVITYGYTANSSLHFFP